MVEIHLRPTTKVIELVVDGATVPARIWQGKTKNGIPVHAFITRVAVPAGRPDREYIEFEEALEEKEPPRPDVSAYDMRYFLD